MKLNKKHLLIIILSIVAISLGACTGGRRIVASGWSGVTVGEETAYFSYGPHAYAINLATGTQQWQYPAEPNNNEDFYAAPVLADDGNQLIVVGYSGSLFSVNPANGSAIWSFNEAGNRYIASPLVTDSAIYAPSSDNTLYALNLDGTPIWQFTTEAPLWASPAWSESCQCIYQASLDHHLYALNPDNGDLIWKTEELGGPVVSQPVISESGLIILGTFNNEVIAINEDNQAIEWRYSTEDWAWASPVIDGEQVYASDISGSFYALDLQSGDLLWKIQPGGGIYSAAYVLDDLVYFSTDASSLVVVSKEGVIQRNQPINGKLYSGPVGADEKLLLTPTDGEFFLVALNENGVQIWGFPPAE
jgi:outer membrane protein assembly factor BamB